MGDHKQDLEALTVEYAPPRSTFEDKFDSLICAIHMLVGQMQAEAERQYRWTLWRDAVEAGPMLDPQEELRNAALAAERRAAGLSAKEMVA